MANKKIYIYYITIFSLSIILFSYCNFNAIRNRNYGFFLNSCEQGDLDKVKEFIESGYNINYERIKSWGPMTYTETPLIMAAKNEHFEVCGYLIENGAKSDGVLETMREFRSIIENCFRLIETYPTKPMNTNPNEYEQKLFNYYKHQKLFPYEDNNYNPNIIDDDGRHLVEFAIENIKYRQMSELFYKGADPHYKTNDGRTILEILKDKHKQYDSFITKYEPFDAKQ